MEEEAAVEEEGGRSRTRRERFGKEAAVGRMDRRKKPGGAQQDKQSGRGVEVTVRRGNVEAEVDDPAWTQKGGEEMQERK